MSYPTIKKLFLVVLGLLIFVMYFELSNISFIKNPKTIPKVSSAFDSIVLEAKGVFVYDVLEERILYAKNENVVRPLASLAKLMTAVSALEVLPKDVPITTTMTLGQNVGDFDLKDNGKWDLESLVSYMLVTSSNDAAEALAVAYGRNNFLIYMNEKSRALGFVNMSFGNPSGLDEEEKPTAFGSPKNVATLMWFGYEHYRVIFERTGFTSYNVMSNDGKPFIATNTNTSFDRLPAVMASKTGFTDAAGGNLAFIADVGLGHPVVVVVMGSTLTGRFDDGVKIVDAIMKDNLNQK